MTRVCDCAGVRWWHEEGLLGCRNRTNTESQPTEGVKVDRDTHTSNVRQFAEMMERKGDEGDFVSGVEKGLAMQLVDIGRSRISAVAAELMDTLIKKNSDYAPTTEFSNFEESARFADITPFELILAQIGIKYSRIRKLNGTTLDPSFESLRDSLVDLAGYAVIAAAWLDMVQEDQHG